MSLSLFSLWTPSSLSPVSASSHTQTRFCQFWQVTTWGVSMTCHFGAVARLPSSPAPWTLWSLYARDKAGAVSRPGGPWGGTPEHQNTSLLPFKHELSDSELILTDAQIQKDTRFSSETSLLVHVGTYSGRSQTEKKPCCHFCLFWGTVWKLFARPVDPAAARKHFLMRTTTVSEAHYTIPDKPASAEPSRRSNHILYLRIEVTYCRFDYRHMRHLLNKWIPELLFNFFYFLSLFGLRSWKIFPTGLQCGQQVGRNAARPSVHAGFHRDYQWWS